MSCICGNIYGYIHEVYKIHFFPGLPPAKLFNQWSKSVKARGNFLFADDIWVIFKYGPENISILHVSAGGVGDGDAGNAPVGVWLGTRIGNRGAGGAGIFSPVEDGHYLGGVVGRISCQELAACGSGRVADLYDCIRDQAGLLCLADWLAGRAISSGGI